MTLTLSLECRGRFARLHVGPFWARPRLATFGRAVVVEGACLNLSCYWRRMVWR
jgi:hypothetical protein